jgi:Fe(3+) dicitrate transport protein
LPYAPRTLLSASAALGYAHPSGLTAQVELVHVGEQFTDDLNTVASSADGQRGLIPDYRVWNAPVSQAVAPLRGDVFVAVKNVLDRTYLADRSRGMIPGAPRLVHVGLTTRF